MNRNSDAVKQRDQVAYHTLSCAGSEIENQVIQQHVNLIQTEQDSVVLFCLHNPYGLHVRADKIVADILELSRSKIKRLMDARKIVIELNGEEIAENPIQS